MRTYTFQLPLFHGVRKVRSHMCDFDASHEFTLCQDILEQDTQYFHLVDGQMRPLSEAQHLYVLNAYQFNFNLIVSSLLRQNLIFGDTFNSNLTVDVTSGPDVPAFQEKAEDLHFWQFSLQLQTIGDVDRRLIDESLYAIDTRYLPITYDEGELVAGYEAKLADIICDFNYQLTTRGQTKHLQVHPDAYTSPTVAYYLIDGGVYVDLRGFSNFAEAYQYIVERLTDEGCRGNPGLESGRDIDCASAGLKLYGVSVNEGIEPVSLGDTLHRYAE